MKKISELENLNESALISDLGDMVYENLVENDFIRIDEGLLKSIIGGAAGYLIGPVIGKAIARVLGVERGLLYDLLTSKLVTTALGIQIGKSK